MAKVRCQVCGAAQDESSTHCRLCGANLATPEVAMVTPSATSPLGRRRSGLAPVLIIAVIGVAAIVVTALVLGFGGGDDVANTIKQDVPALRGNQYDGWQTVDDGDGAITFSMPGQATKGFVTFSVAPDGRAEQWVAPIGQETVLSVSYTQVTVPPDSSATDALRQWADQWAADAGGKVNQPIDETTYQGYPAIEFGIRGLELNGTAATAQTMMVLKGGTLYIVQSETVYANNDQYSRLANSLAFTA